MEEYILTKGKFFLKNPSSMKEGKTKMVVKVSFGCLSDCIGVRSESKGDLSVE